MNPVHLQNEPIRKSFLTLILAAIPLAFFPCLALAEGAAPTTTTTMTEERRNEVPVPQQENHQNQPTSATTQGNTGVATTYLTFLADDSSIPKQPASKNESPVIPKNLFSTPVSIRTAPVKTETTTSAGTSTSVTTQTQEKPKDSTPPDQNRTAEPRDILKTYYTFRPSRPLYNPPTSDPTSLDYSLYHSRLEMPKQDSIFDVPKDSLLSRGKDLITKIGTGVPLKGKVSGYFQGTKTGLRYRF